MAIDEHTYPSLTRPAPYKQQLVALSATPYIYPVTKMHFPLGVTNSEIPPLGITTSRQIADYGIMSIQHSMAMSNPASSSLHFLNQSGGHGGSEVETLIKFPPPHMDDLSAVVTKCSNPHLYPYAGLIPSCGCGFNNSLPDAYFNGDNNQRVHCMHRKIGAIATHPMPPFPSNERRGVDAYKPLKRKRHSGCETSAALSEREIHILSERQRRSGMNQLLTKMCSLLPAQSVKSDKIGIVAETIKYIHYLQQRLLSRSKKVGCGAETGGSCESHQSTTGSSDFAILPEVSLKSHASKDVFITIKCAKKHNLLPSIIVLLEGQKMEVMDAFVSTNGAVVFHSLHLKALHSLDAACREALTDTLNKLIKSELQITLGP